MQNKGQFEQKVWELVEQAQKDMVNNCLHLYDSGGVDPTSFEDDFELPRVIFRIALEHEAEQIAPDHWLKPGQKLGETYHNLKHF